MIRLKHFPIEECEKANEFMLEHPPRFTEKQSGIVFHNSAIVILYDDGIHNPKEEEHIIQMQIRDDGHKMMLSKQSLETAKAGLVQEEAGLKKVAPPGYVRGMNDEELKEVLQKNSENPHIPKKLVDSVRSNVGPYEMRLDGLENEILMHDHELRRLELSVKGWESLLPKK